MKETEDLMLLSFLTAGSLCDARDYKVPNTLIALGYITGAYINVASFGVKGIAFFLIKGLWPILLLYILFLARGLGAGDIKLFSVMSTMVGGALTGRSMILSVILAAVAVLFLCIRHKAIPKIKLHYSYYITASFLLILVKEELSLWQILN